MKDLNKNIKYSIVGLIFTIAVLFIPTYYADADTYSAGSYGQVNVVVNLSNGPTYHVNDPFQVTGMLTLSTGSVNQVDMSVIAGGILASIFDPQPLNGGSIFNTKIIPGATASLGSYLADFSTGVDEIDDVVILDPPPSNDPGYYAHCFIAGTMVTLADGTKKKIEDVKIGDILKGATTNNTVLSFHRPKLGNEQLYSFNRGEYFVTAEHPFKTTDGWKSIDPEKTANENIGITVTKLGVGDTLVTANGLVKLNTIDSKYESPDTNLYNFILDGDHTYYADDYLVHNKASCSNGLSSPPACSNGAPCIDSDAGSPSYLMPVLYGQTGECALACSGNPPSSGGTCPKGGGMYCSTSGYKKCN